MPEMFLKPLTFFETVKAIIVFYGYVFKYLIGLVILASIAQGLVSIIMPANPTIGLAISVLASIVYIFFYAWILSHANGILMGSDPKVRESLKVAKSRFLQLVTLLALYLVLAFVLILFGMGMNLVGSVLGIPQIFGLLTLIIFIVIFTFLAFAMPSLIIDDEPAVKSFEYSIRLVWGHWWHLVGLFLLFVIPVITLSLGVMLLPSKNIFAITLYEFFVHIMTYPLMISLVLVIYHDLKTRKQIKSFKNLDEISHSHR